MAERGPGTLPIVSSVIHAEELKAQAALAGLDGASLATLARRARYATVAAGDVVAGADGPARPPALIKDGVAWVLRHGHRVNLLGPGELISVDKADRRRRAASIVAVTPMRLILLPGLDRELAAASQGLDGTSSTDGDAR